MNHVVSIYLAPCCLQVSLQVELASAQCSSFQKIYSLAQFLFECGLGSKITIFKRDKGSSDSFDEPMKVFHGPMIFKDYGRHVI